MDKGKPIEIDSPDFPDTNEDKIMPHGLYDMVATKGWVNVGISHDTSGSAVKSIRSWWKKLGG